MESTRLPRFRRVAEPPPIRLTGRDLDVLGQVRKHRFLRSTHLAQLIGGSQQQLLRRLQRLYHQGHLDRPRAQLDYFHQTGSKPIVYGLGRKGARLMQAGEACEHRRQTRSGFAGRVFLEHALMVAAGTVNHFPHDICPTATEARTFTETLTLALVAFSLRAARRYLAAQRINGLAFGDDDGTEFRRKA